MTPETDTTTTLFSLVVALTAIVIPSITAYWQYKSSVKLARFSASYKDKIDVFTQLIMLYRHNSFNKAENEFRNDVAKTALRASTYCTKQRIRRLLFRFAEEVRSNGQTATADKLFSKCISLMRKEV